MNTPVINIPTIIATIKPMFAGMIRTNKKKYELRKRSPNLGLPFRVLMCESGSNGRITGSFIVSEITEVRDPRMFGHNWFYNNVGITDDQANRYLSGHVGHLWKISHMVNFCNTPGCSVQNISDYGLTRAPQSWQHIGAEYDLTPQEQEAGK